MSEDNIQTLTVGDLLKSKREEKGLSLEIVHDETKIPMDAIKAIEEGYTIRTLSDFYRRSFLKKYAQYLKVDISQVEERQEEEAAQETPQPEPQPEESKKETEPKAKKEPINWDELIAEYLPPQRRKLLLRIVLGIVALFIIVKFIAFLANREPKQEVKITDVRQEFPKEEVKEVVQQIPAVVQEVMQQPVSETAENIPPQETVQAPIAKQINLTVRADDKSWLRVKTDGAVVFQSTLRDGAVETWEADEEIEISGRNLNKLEFELNGKLIGKLGREDRKAKKVIITKDGLTVAK